MSACKDIIEPDPAPGDERRDVTLQVPERVSADGEQTFRRLVLNTLLSG